MNYSEIDKLVRSYYKKDNEYQMVEKEDGFSLVKDNRPFFTLTKVSKHVDNLVMEDNHYLLLGTPYLFCRGYGQLFLSILTSNLVNHHNVNVYGVEVTDKYISYILEVDKPKTTYTVLVDTTSEDYLDNCEDVIEAIHRREAFFSELQGLMTERPHVVSAPFNRVIGNMLRELPLAFFVDNRVTCAEGRDNTVVINYNYRSARTDLTLRSLTEEDKVKGAFFGLVRMKELPSLLRRALRDITKMNDTLKKEVQLINFFLGDVYTTLVITIGGVVLDYKEVRK